MSDTLTRYNFPNRELKSLGNFTVPHSSRTFRNKVERISAYKRKALFYTSVPMNDVNVKAKLWARVERIDRIMNTLYREGKI